MGPQRLSPEDVRRRAVGAWLTDAYADLANARSLAAHRDEGTTPFASAFHAEQAVEKGLKALHTIFAGRLPREKFASFENYCFALHNMGISEEKLTQLKVKANRLRLNGAGCQKGEL